VKKFSSRVNDFLRGSGHNLKVIGKLWFNYKIMYRILIAEDEVKIAAFMEKGFKKQRFANAVAEDGWNRVLASASPSRLALATCFCECDRIWRKRHLACPPAD
jgi:hypothetical protein